MTKAGKPDDELGYEAAAAQLEAILEELERGSAGVDTLTQKVEQAAALIRHCRARLSGTELRVAKVLEALEADERAAAEPCTREEGA